MELRLQEENPQGRGQNQLSRELQGRMSFRIKRTPIPKGRGWCCRERGGQQPSLEAEREGCVLQPQAGRWRKASLRGRGWGSYQGSGISWGACRFHPGLGSGARRSMMHWPLGFPKPLLSPASPRAPACPRAGNPTPSEALWACLFLPLDRATGLPFWFGASPCRTVSRQLVSWLRAWAWKADLV